MNTPRVFLVQEPLRRSASSGSPVPLFDLTPAKEFGEIITCLDWSDTRSGFDPDVITDKLYRQLEDFCDDDFILPTGNTVAIALAGAIAADVNNGVVKFLVWNKLPLPGKYRVIETKLWQPENR